MHNSYPPQVAVLAKRVPYTLASISGILLIMLTPLAVLGHAGHGDEFHQEGGEQAQAADAIQVDAVTAQRLNLKIEPVTRQQLAIGIKTTGQIEPLPNQKVEVKAPVDGTIAELLVKPGDKVAKGQPVAVLTSAELAQLRVESTQKQAEAETDIKQAQADLQLAQQNLERQREIATAEIEQARTELRVAQEQYDKDKELVNAGALPRRQMLESQAHLSAAKAQLTKAISSKEVIAAENQLKRAQASVQVAQSRLRLSNTGYQTRLQQLGTVANETGLVTIVAPIAGTVANREITPGESVKAAEQSLMTLLNDSKVFVTANIYEKDLNQIRKGQQVRVKVPGIDNRSFTGTVSLIGSVVTGETRVVPVKAELNNSHSLLKPGMFAELEIVTNQTAASSLVIPSSAVVEANGKKIVYIQNGNAFQPTEVTLGQTSSEMVEVKTGLFEGDLIVTQRAPLLYAQSLRTNKSSASVSAPNQEEAEGQVNPTSLPWWLILPIGGAIATATFFAGSFWASRRPLKTSDKYKQPSFSVKQQEP